MRFDPRESAQDLPKLSAKDVPIQHRRRSGRLPQEALICNFGMVLDLSVGGMRVICRKAPMEPVEIQMLGFDLPGPLKAIPAWSKRVGFFKSEVGFRFEDITPEMGACLTRIAATHRFRRVI